MNLESVRIVLVRPEEAGNVGAAARVIKNFGLGHLVLVAPRTARPEESYKWAKGAEDVLEGAEVVDDLGPAVASCVQVWAATRRRGKLRGSHVDIRDAAADAVRLANDGQAVAWVFGPESRGLRTEETELCTARVTIPTAPEQPSLNLAQAVAVCAHETKMASLVRHTPLPRRQATVDERNALYRHFEQALLAVGFLHPHTARSRMAAVRAILERAQLSPREARLLRGVARQMEWAAGEGPPDPGEDADTRPVIKENSDADIAGGNEGESDVR